MRKSTFALAALAIALLGAPAMAQTQLGFPNLPGSFTALPYSDDFEGHAGVVPAHMAVNELNAATLANDPLAWCNIGQNAACINPNSGSFNLEMGNVPNTSNFIDVLNGLVVGMDGTGYTGVESIRFWAIDGGEETDPEDGVWVSDDGVDYYSVFGPWTSIPDNVWTEQVGINYGGTAANTSGQFYMAFSQNDNFPYLDLDGIGIDDIEIPSPPATPTMETSPATLSGGQYGLLISDRCEPNETVCFWGSLQLGSSSVTCGGVGINLGLQNPIAIGSAKADSVGLAQISLIIPAKVSGRMVHLQSGYNNSQVGGLASAINSQTVN